jgi:hypothetical protein
VQHGWPTTHETQTMVSDEQAVGVCGGGRPCLGFALCPLRLHAAFFCWLTADWVLSGMGIGGFGCPTRRCWCAGSTKNCTRVRRSGWRLLNKRSHSTWMDSQDGFLAPPPPQGLLCDARVTTGPPGQKPEQSRCFRRQTLGIHSESGPWDLIRLAASVLWMVFFRLPYHLLHHPRIDRQEVELQGAGLTQHDQGCRALCHTPKRHPRGLTTFG